LAAENIDNFTIGSYTGNAVKDKKNTYTMEKNIATMFLIKCKEAIKEGFQTLRV
jgi:hypothetical protein